MNTVIIPQNVNGAIFGGTDDQEAFEVPYNPAIVTDWDGDVDPGNTDDALDQLAARSNVLEGLGGSIINTTIVNTAYPVVSTDVFIGADPTVAGFTITLEAAPADGRRIIVKDVAGTASGINNVIINGNGNNIDGAATQEIRTAFASLVFVYELSLDAWFIV